ESPSAQGYRRVAPLGLKTPRFSIPSNTAQAASRNSVRPCSPSTVHASPNSRIRSDSRFLAATARPGWPLFWPHESHQLPCRAPYLVSGGRLLDEADPLGISRIRFRKPALAPFEALDAPGEPHSSPR